MQEKRKFPKAKASQISSSSTNEIPWQVGSIVLSAYLEASADAAADYGAAVDSGKAEVGFDAETKPG